MTQLLLLIRDLLQLKRGPQDVPYSPQLLLLLIGFSTVLDLTIGSVLNVGPNLLQRSLLSTALPLLLLYAVLGIRNLRARFVQTASALMVVGMIFSLLIFPLGLLIGKSPTTPQEVTPLHGIISLIALMLFMWNLTVHAHIFRHALNLPLMSGFLLALMWIVTSTVGGNTAS